MLFRSSNVPHASVCGGRGRCSTCRVRITKGFEDLPEPSAAEQKVLDRVNAGIQVRLACQTRPKGGEIEVIRLLPTTAQPEDGFPRPEYLQGQEREIAILFADLRGFTTWAESLEPEVMVDLLNTKLGIAVDAIATYGGLRGTRRQSTVIHVDEDASEAEIEAKFRANAAYGGWDAGRAGRLLALIISDVVGDRLDTIASGPTYPDATTDEEALEVLEGAVRRLHVEEGAAVFREGQPSEDIYVVDRGTISIQRDTPFGTQALATVEQIGRAHV